MSHLEVGEAVIEEVGTRIIDFHAHIWGDRNRRDADTLVTMLDRYDLAWIGVSCLAGGQQPTQNDIRRANDATAELQKREPERVVGFCYLNPRLGASAVDEFRRCHDVHGMRFIKLWISAHADDPCVFPIVERAIDHRVPILQHAFCKSTGLLQYESDPTHVANLARRYPEAKIIMAHMGADFIFGCNAIRDCPNVWADVSGSYCETGMVDYAVDQLGSERIIFATDAPGASFLNNLHKVLDTPLTDEQKRKIFHDNAEGLRQCTV